jgi:hypothetical protein
VLTGSEAKAGLSNATNFAGQPYNIFFVGDPLTSYSENVILHSAVEKEAFERHCSYCNGDAEKIEDFWRYEYCYSSSMAATIHDDAKKLCGIAGASKKVDEQADEERDVLEDLEHRRWNVYMRSEGYIYSGSPEKASRNDLAKKHHNLIPFAQLSDEDKRKDSRVAAKVDGE